MMAYVCLAACVIAEFVCLTKLAIHFDKWWIVLFALLLTFSVKGGKTDKPPEDG